MMDKIRLKYGYGFYRNRENVPIMEVAEALGITPVKGKICCPCPDHEDKNPSCQISAEKNYWKCFSCGESGGALELVVAIREGISPSQFWALKDSDIKKFMAVRDRAVLFIDKLFPGNLEVVSGEKKRGVVNDIPFPDINPKFWKDIGLKNPFIPYVVKDRVSEDERSGHLINDQLNEELAAEMTIGKAFDAEEAARNEPFDIFRKYPDIPSKTKAYMIQESLKRAEEIAVQRKAIEQYITEKYNVPALSFDPDEIDLEEKEEL